MKKQIDPTIKAHLIRGAFYLLLLAVCAIPFALAQRNGGKQTVTRAPFNKSQIPKFPYSSFRERGSASAAPVGEETATPPPTASPASTPTATPTSTPPVAGCGLLVGAHIFRAAHSRWLSSLLDFAHNRTNSFGRVNIWVES